MTINKNSLFLALLIALCLFVKTPSASAVVHYFFSRSLTTGMRGDDVTALQNFLIENSSKSSWPQNQNATGYFGSVTLFSLKTYQKTVGISPASGYFGPITRSYVNNFINGIEEDSIWPEYNPQNNDSLTVYSPSNAAVWKAGESYNITWDKNAILPNLSHSVDIDLTNQDGNGRLSISRDVQNTGQFNWTIPTNITNGIYQIEVNCRILSEVRCPNGVSTPFVITNSSSTNTASIAILSPKKGDVLKKGSTSSIQWTSQKINGISPVYQITYERPTDSTFGYSGFFIAMPSQTDSSYTWQIPAEFIDTGNYQIRISCLPAMRVYGCEDAVSGLFAVVDSQSGLSNLTVVSPNVSTTWVAGQKYKVEWTTDNIAQDVLVEVYLTNGPTPQTIYSGQNTGSGEVFIPDNVEPGTYGLLFRAIKDGHIYDDGRSDATINIPIGPNNIPKPSTEDSKINISGETEWKIGETQIIHWSPRLQEVDTTTYGFCESANVVVIDDATGDVAGYAFYIYTGSQIDGQAWTVGTVMKTLCNGGGIVTLPTGKYHFRLSYINPLTGKRVETDSDSVTFTR